MNDTFTFEIEPFKLPAKDGMSEHGRWFRRGRNIVVLYPDAQSLAENDEAYELPGSGVPSRKDLIHPRIDFHAQEALYRMLKGDPGARADASGMLAAVQAGQLAGIYIIDQRAPAMRARKMNTWWWLVIPKGEDAVLLLDPANPQTGIPLIAFKDMVKSDPSRLDPALRKAWVSFKLIHTNELIRCDLLPSTHSMLAGEASAFTPTPVVANIFPPLCAQPRLPSLPKPAKPPRPKPSTVDGCKETIRVATNFKDYVALVRRAESALIKCGHTNLVDRLHILSGVYYGTTWSRDFDVEKSSARNVAFQIFLARSYTRTDDPRPCLGCGLFLSLKRSQDVGGVDMGHVLIGLNARMRFAARDIPIPPTSSTGLELTTWVGDLAGASARLAMDRVKGPGTPASRYFSGTDYGASSNLEGDVAASLIDAPGLSPAVISAPAIPPAGLISPSLESYFVKGIGHADRCHDFLLLQGATFSGRTLVNRGSVRDHMANKFEGFGQLYMGNYLRQRGLSASTITSIMTPALPRLPRAASDVADLFIDKLLSCRF